MPDRKKYAAIMAGLSVVLCLVAVASLFVGRYSLSVDEIMQVLLHAKLSAKDEANYSVIFSLRVPRVIAVMMVGGGLSVAGATFQAVLKNSLASPDVLGTSSASAFGAALGILFSFPFALSSLCSLFFGIKNSPK